MFRFESFYMVGIIGSAIVTSMVSVGLLHLLGTKAFNGEANRVTPKAMTWRHYVFSGLIFGVGCGLAGGCPGPMFVLLGTWLYGARQSNLPESQADFFRFGVR